VVWRREIEASNDSQTKRNQNHTMDAKRGWGGEQSGGDIGGTNPSVQIKCMLILLNCRKA